MTSEEMEKHGISPVEYAFSADERVRVAWRGAAAWAITLDGACLNREGEWEHEPLPSSRDQAFFERCRFGLDDALRRAVEKLGEV